MEWACAWDGDGVYELVSNTTGLTSLTLDETGAYMVKLRVKDNEGATGFTQLTVTVKEENETGNFLPLPYWLAIAAFGLTALALRKMPGRKD